jgi:hypothetical protein
MTGVGEAREQHGDRRRVVGDHVGLRRDVVAGVAQHADEGRPALVRAVPRRRAVRARDDDGLVRRALRRRRARRFARVALVVARGPARLRDQLHALDDDVALERLRHVVQGERRHRCRGERLHLDARSCRRPDLGPDLDDPRVAARQELEVDPVQRQRVAQRDEVRGPLRGADAGQARGHQRVALRPSGVQQRGEYLGPHADRGPGDGAPRGHRLVADVHHARRSLLVEMRGTAHSIAPVTIAS